MSAFSADYKRDQQQTNLLPDATEVGVTVPELETVDKIVRLTNEEEVQMELLYDEKTSSAFRPSSAVDVNTVQIALT